MLKIISWICCLFCFPAMAQLVELKGVVTYSNDYCGGAAPSEEIIKDSQTKKPYANIQLYIRKGEQNNIKSRIIAKIKTDSLGCFCIKLKPGTYVIVDARKKDARFINSLVKKSAQPKSMYKLSEKKCLLHWLQKPDAVVRLTASAACEIHYVLQCDWNKYPCLQYSGPMPP